jgi:hypothetical protein
MYRSLGGERKAVKKFAVVLCVVIGAWISSPTPEAQAWGRSNQGNRGNQGNQGNRGNNGHTSKARVPELDPSAAGGAMVLLLGGMAYISSRRREEDLV